MHVVARPRGIEVARSTPCTGYDGRPEGGFVRTLQADRWLPNWTASAGPPMRSSGSATPTATAIAGARYATATTAKPQEPLALVAAATDAADGWRRDGEGAAWRTEGRRIRLASAAGERDAAGTGCVLDVEPDAQ